MRTCEVSTVTPFRYTGLLFALILGVIMFAEKPDLLTLVGSAIIVFCGILMLTRKSGPRIHRSKTLRIG